MEGLIQEVNRRYLNDLESYITKNNPNLIFSEFNNHSRLKKDNLNSQIEKIDIVLKIVNQIEFESDSIVEILNSNYFLISGIAEKTNLKEIQRFREAVGNDIEKCISGIFISK